MSETPTPVCAITIAEVETFRRDALITLCPEQMMPWALHENRVLNALCDHYVAALAGQSRPLPQLTTPLLLRAAELLELHADELKAGHTLADGTWPDHDDSDRQAKADHDEMRQVVEGLRSLDPAQEQPDKQICPDCGSAGNCLAGCPSRL